MKIARVSFYEFVESKRHGGFDPENMALVTSLGVESVCPCYILKQDVPALFCVEPFGNIQCPLMVIEVNFACEQASELAETDLLILNRVRIRSRDWARHAACLIPSILIHECVVDVPLDVLQDKWCSNTLTLVFSRSTSLYCLPLVDSMYVDLSSLRLAPIKTFPSVIPMTPESSTDSFVESSQNSVTDLPCGPKNLHLLHVMDTKQECIQRCSETLRLLQLDESVLRVGLANLDCKTLVVSQDTTRPMTQGTTTTITRCTNLEHLTLHDVLLGFRNDLRQLKHLFLYQSWSRALTLCPLEEILPLLETFECLLKDDFFHPRCLPKPVESVEVNGDFLPEGPAPVCFDFVYEVRLAACGHQHLQSVVFDYTGPAQVEMTYNPNLELVQLCDGIEFARVTGNPKLGSVQLFRSETTGKKIELSDSNSHVIQKPSFFHAITSVQCNLLNEFYPE